MCNVRASQPVGKLGRINPRFLKALTLEHDVRSPVQPALRAEIERESARPVLVKQQVQALVPRRLFERRPDAPRT